MSGFIQVAKSKQVKENRPFSVFINGKKIVLIRHQGEIKAFKDACPHQGAPLSHGSVKDGQIICLYHGWIFNLHDGSFLANNKLKLERYSVKESEGNVLLQLN